MPRPKQAEEGHLTNIVLTAIGLVLTAGVFGLAWFFVDAHRQAELNESLLVVLLRMELNEVGDFFAGFAAALAFIWLVIGYFLQSAELKLQRKELGEQRLETARLADEANRQSEAISANEMHARRDTFFRIAELHERDINHHAFAMMDAILDVQAKVDDETSRPLSDRRIEYLKIGSEDNLWAKFSNGNHFVFTNLLSHVLENIDPLVSEKILTSDKMKTGARRYCRVFEKIIEESAACNDGGVLRGEYEWSPHGEAYMLLCGRLEKALIPGFRDGRVPAAFKGAGK